MFSKKAAPVSGRVGVLLMSTGTPEEPTPKAVKKYLGRFLWDPRIRPMFAPLWWLILHLFILPKRAHASAEKYAQIWTPAGSPLMVAADKLARGMERHYQEAGRDVVVRMALTYMEPSVKDVLKELRDAGCSRLIVLPLYPQTAYSCSGPLVDAFYRAFPKTHWKVPYQVIDGYYENPVYLAAIAASLRNAGFDPSPESSDRIIFSYHSIPLNDIEHGDTYELQVGATSLAIAGELGIERTRWTIGYQCQFDKGREWLKPFTINTLTTWAETGTTDRVFVVCPNFAFDCLETLYDIEIEFKNAFLEKGGSSFTYVPCLNASKAHLRVVAQVLEPYLDGSAR